MAKNEDKQRSKDLKEIARTFDKNSMLTKKDYAALDAELKDDETILYIARANLITGEPQGLGTLVREVAAVLTDKRFYYTNAKASLLSFGATSVAQESVSLGDVTEVSLEMMSNLLGSSPYVKMMTGSGAYRLELPRNSTNASKNQADWINFVKIFQDAQVAYANEHGAAKGTEDDVFDDSALYAEGDFGDVYGSKKSVDTDDQLDQLERLASLRDRGIITEEEFQAKKKEILGL